MVVCRVNEIYGRDLRFLILGRAISLKLFSSSLVLLWLCWLWAHWIKLGIDQEAARCESIGNYWNVTKRVDSVHALIGSFPSHLLK